MFQKKEIFKQSQLGKCIAVKWLTWEESVKLTLYGLDNSLLTGTVNLISEFWYYTELIKTQN